MARDGSPAAVHFTVFRSAHEEVAYAVYPSTPEQSRFHPRLELEAAYFSRRATEERQASRACLSRKSREVHLELAVAYEFRAHLLTQQVSDSAAYQVHAL